MISCYSNPSQSRPNMPALILLLVMTTTLLLQPSAQATEGHPFLWQIDSGSQPSYLFGTIHSGHPELNQLPASVELAFAKVDRFYGELVLDSATLTSTSKLLQLEPDQTLSQQLSGQRQQRINQVLNGIAPGLNLALFDQFKPWALTVALALLEDQLRYGQLPAMDLSLYQRAVASGKFTGALETPQQQMQLFEQFDFEEQMQMLDATLTAMEQSQTQQHSWMNPTYQAYRSGDPDQFNQLMVQQMPLQQSLHRKLIRLLLTERNQRMAQQIDQQLRQHPNQQHFFAVGAAHFSSQGGIQQILQQQGYSVHRLP